MIPLATTNSYARLPEAFFSRVAPTPVAAPQLIRLNTALARQLGIDPEWLASEHGIAVLAGNGTLEGAEPIAMAYAGHQFGNWVPQLGDGRAILLGEVIDSDGVRRDIQLKGAGRTPYSRRGDGRAALGPVLREYIVSEAMFALGIPTTRSLAMVTTGERILREGPVPGAILTRVARSHVRVGTFEYFSYRGDTESVRVLADYMIARVYPHASDTPQPYRALLDAVVGQTAKLIASWQLVGFIHGVMNTDNMSISGETIDYGPCAFMDAYDPATVYSSIDSAGRYAYGNQAPIAHWNMARFAQALLPLLADEETAAIESAQDAINAFPAAFNTAYLAGMGRKLGVSATQPGDQELAADLLERMAANKADYTLTFRHLADAAGSEIAADAAVGGLFDDPTAFDSWAALWRQRLAQEPGTAPERRAAMRAENPAFIPRNHRIAAVIEAAQNEADFSLLDEMMTVLATPFSDHPGAERYAEPPQPHEVVHRTFCGT